MTKLSIENLATCRAALDAGQTKETVVAELGETVASWADLEERILAELADEADRGAFQRIEAYQTAYKAAWARWVEASGEPRTPSVASGIEASTSGLDTTSEIARAPAEPALPFAASATPSRYAVRPDPHEPPAAPASGSSLETTAEVASSVAKPALPFGERSTAPAASSAAVSPGKGTGPNHEATAAIAALRADAHQEADADDLDGTREMVGGVLPAQALPFGAAAFGSATAAPPQEASRPFAMRTGTEDVDVAQLRALVNPFGGARDAAAWSAMTVEQYAKLRARLTVNGEHDTATWAEFGIRSAQEKDQVQRRFAALFRGDSSAQQRFLELVRRLATELAAASKVGSSTAADPPHATAVLEAGAFRAPEPSPDESDLAAAKDRKPAR